MNTRELPREDIARLAYQLWEERGCPVGSPEVDWERAEKALMYDATSMAELQGEDTEIAAKANTQPVRKPDGGAPPKNSRRPARSTARTSQVR